MAMLESETPARNGSSWRGLRRWSAVVGMSAALAATPLLAACGSSDKGDTSTSHVDDHQHHRIDDSYDGDDHGWRHRDRCTVGYRRPERRRRVHPRRTDG